MTSGNAPLPEKHNHTHTHTQNRRKKKIKEQTVCSVRSEISSLTLSTKLQPYIVSHCLKNEKSCGWLFKLETIIVSLTVFCNSTLKQLKHLKDWSMRTSEN